MDTSDHNRKVRDFFDHTASTYASKINPWMTLRRAKLIRAVARGRIVDVGVGPGQLAQLYSSSPIVACDVSLKMLKLARQRLKHSHFVVCNAENLPFKRGSFDTVVGSEIIYYLRNPRNFLRGVSRVLAPGGQLIFLWGNPTFNFLYRLASILGLRPIDPFGLTTPSRAQVLKMLTSEFRPCRVEFYAIGLPFGISKGKAAVILTVSPVNAVVAQLE